MRKTLEERKEARRAKCDKAAPSLGIEMGLQDKKAELLIVRWLTRRESMTKRLAALDVKIAAFRKRCKHVYGAADVCKKCAQKSPGNWLPVTEDALAE